MYPAALSTLYDMTFDEWLPSVPARLTRDPIWRRNDYRLAVYVSDVAWPHVVQLARNPATRHVAGQLHEALGSIRSHIAEGYSRGSGADRVRFYEYALGSARESREWYWGARHVIGDEPAERQCETLDSIVRLLLTAIPSERSERFRASPPREIANARRPKRTGENP
jgi:four helix bundle protein